MTTLRAKILVTDDVPENLRSIARMLRAEYNVSTCSSPKRAARIARSGRIDLLVTTLVMRELDGFGLIRRLRGADCQIPIIIVTGYGDDTSAIEATRLGVADYITKPFSEKELLQRTRRVLDRRLATRPAGSEPPPTSSPIITADPTMIELLEQCRRIARSDSRVLIFGETGSGKELLARFIHDQSPRHTAPYVEVNCAAIPENLHESEFFGHERGSFTGAIQRRIGRFEEAGEGTLFLDEIGETSFSLQTKLLRVLQTGIFSRVGQTGQQKSHARILAATNRDLTEEARTGRFRADLFYRLNVISLRLPPLRDRPGDIPLLARHFAGRAGRDGTDPISFSPEAIKILTHYSWPGNIRELEHTIERLAVLSPDTYVTAADLTSLSELPDADSAAPPHLPYREAINDFERSYFSGLLKRTRGNLAAAARLAGMDRANFFRKAIRHGLHNPKSDDTET